MIYNNRSDDDDDDDVHFVTSDQLLLLKLHSAFIDQTVLSYQRLNDHMIGVHSCLTCVSMVTTHVCLVQTDKYQPTTEPTH